MGNSESRLAQTMIGAVLGALIVSVLPALAAQVGDPLALGQVNKLDERTDLKGKAKGANLQIKNTGNASALTAKADRQAIKAKATDGPVGINVKADRVGVKIRVDDGFAPIKVNKGAGTATNLSADLLDGRNGDELVRAAHADGSSGVAGFVAFTLPTDGVVLFGGSAEVGFTSIAGTARCYLDVDSTPIGETEREVHVSSTHPTDICSISGALELEAGTYQIRMVAVHSVSGFEGDTDLWLLFVPFGAAGEIIGVP